MNVLGLSYDFHDGAAALVRDGRLVGVAAEERLSLQKHDSSYPALAVSSLLAQQGLEPGDLDEVAYYERPAVKYSRILTSGFARFPRGARSFVAANKQWLRDRLWVRTALSSRFGLPPSRVHMLPHHDAHAAQAFLASPFEHAAVLVLDGVGEWDCTTLAVAESRHPLRLRTVESYAYPNSIGLLYAAFTAYLGFKPNSGEASTMALAAFGRPRYAEAMRRVFGLQCDGRYEIERRFFDFEAGPGGLFTEQALAVFGPPRDFRRPYGFDALRDEQDHVDADDQRCADIAASLQMVLAEALTGLCNRLRRYTASDNLCLAGGVALNCLANTHLVEHGGYANVFIPPEPGDGGACFGAALQRAAQRGPVAPMAHPYLGLHHPVRELDPLLQASPDGAFLLGHELEGVTPARRIESLEVDDEAHLLDRVCDDLMQGRIVGWIQGCYEVGPRALGNRSLLVAPGQLDAVRRMSRLVKSHTHFRPYALSIAEDEAAAVLHCEHLEQPVLRWMQTIWPVRDSCRLRLRGAIHADGTTRPQLCGPQDNPRYWALLKRFGQASGLSALLNTSLNERSLPMVGDPRMGLAMFARTGMDTLVIDNRLFRKHY